MPATPAWPPQSTPRLFVEHMLAEGPIRIDGPAAHYLVSVMRTRVGDPVKLFDDPHRGMAGRRGVGRQA
ncbi:16S rRNA U1498 N3-methylase RsmE [Sphingomonas sp. SORGH_AS 879]|nr:16S rRNA U1498 N3-methylase RsmE [Sphingomonas sp. SORGH_AS_0879]